MEARRYYVSGIVQGVGYRFFAVRAARRLELRGYAKNLRDGRVEVYAAGRPEQLEALRAELGRGPASARVAAVTEMKAALEPGLAVEFSVEFDE